ncbi:glomulin, FKBP associated protein b isoform X2 [Brachyhypopomus gauderio]|uniref:glomulin, FKBP associated protein b isoform X2 n=1 Tax=Brachyhypopomus gauderio TaxID=698409 RepID=UPI0040429F57
MGSGLLGLLVEEVMRKERDHAHCQSVITHLVKICNAGDVLHILLRHVEDTDPNAIADSITFLTQHIQTVLIRLGDTKPALLGLALDALHKQMTKLPVPYLHKQEQEDEYGLGRSCTALMTFVQPFVQEVKSQDTTSPVTSSSSAELKSVLLKFCMESLREPLLEVQFDRKAETSQNSALWSFATEIMAILPAIQEPLCQLLFYHRLRRKDDMRVVKDNGSRQTESRACLAYLLLVQLIAMEVFPAVFSPVFVLQCNMEYIDVLLSRKDESWVLKGLQLYDKSLGRLLDNSLSIELLDMKPFHSVLHNLLKIMMECPIQHLKAKAIMVFQLFIEKLNGEAKHKFFRCFMKTSKHAGVESVILKNIQNHLVHSSKSRHKDGWFEGTLLISLLRETVSLPEGPETDLLHGMDRVMVSLNLLRYLLIKEKKNLS